MVQVREPDPGTTGKCPPLLALVRVTLAIRVQIYASVPETSLCVYLGEVSTKDDGPESRLIQVSNWVEKQSECLTRSSTAAVERNVSVRCEKDLLLPWLWPDLDCLHASRAGTL